MTKIKLRAYDKKRGYMLPLEEDPDYMFGIDEKGCLYLIRDGNPMKDEDYELIRFTGLLDKNGKEIYEGDIVCYGPWSDGEGFCRHIVEWNIKDAAFGTYEPRREKEHFPNIDERVCEVIGNIYENPELLN